MPKFKSFVHPKLFQDCSNQNRGIYTIPRNIVTGVLPECTSTAIDFPVTDVSIYGLENTMAWWWLFYKLEASVTITLSKAEFEDTTITQALTCLADFNPRDDRICWEDYYYPAVESPASPDQAFLYNLGENLDTVSFIFETKYVTIAQTDSPNYDTTYSISFNVQSHPTLNHVNESIGCPMPEVDGFIGKTVEFFVGGVKYTHPLYIHVFSVISDPSLTFTVDNSEITKLEMWEPS